MTQSEPQEPLQWVEAERREAGASRITFHDQLEDCNRMVVAVGTRVADEIVPVTTAFLEADAGRAHEAIAHDRSIDRRCLELEEACYVLLARQSPVSGDLRRIVAMLRSVAAIERSGDLLVHVARSLQWVHPPAMPDVLRDPIRQLGATAAEIFAGAVEAWRTHDPLAAVELQDSDDQVDLLQKVLLTELYTGQQSVEETVSLALLARYYERIADHGVEIARHVAYFTTGERITGSTSAGPN